MGSKIVYIINLITYRVYDRDITHIVPTHRAQSKFDLHISVEYILVPQNYYCLYRLATICVIVVSIDVGISIIIYN